ncbi:MAG: response regulator [Candidatus Marinimicrobia bacterium]|nr:response regulator [Candidatus Neomarinimicrobiota bacterium]MCF7879998.1 response regulator [Candidatus Neomarinimicrobiota bacterium]
MHRVIALSPLPAMVACGLLILLLVCPHIVTAQPYAVQYQHLGSHNGLSQNRVQAIAEDHRGYIWFGTQDGLNRFDGYQIKVFRHIPMDSTSLRNNYITSLVVDSAGVLWIGTHTGGLHRYNHRYESFQSIPLRMHTGNRSEPLINDLHVDSLGRLWIATESAGLLQYDPITKSSYSKWIPESPDGAIQGLVSVLYDAHGNLWAGTNTGQVYVRRKGAETFRPLRLENPKPYSNNPARINNLFQDSRGQIWVGTNVGGGRVSPSLETYRTITLGRIDTTREVTSFCEDKAGVIWIGTAASGYYQFDPETEEVRRFAPAQVTSRTLDDGGILAIHISREQLIWLGMNGTGVYYFDPTPPFKQFQHLKYSRDNPLGTSVGGRSVRSMYEVGDSLLYTGSYGGFTAINLFSGEVTDVPLYLATVYAITQDPYGNLWIGTEGTGLFRYNPKTGESIQYRDEPGSSDGLTDDFVFELFLDTGNYLWIGTENGLTRIYLGNGSPEFAPVPTKLQTFLSDKAIYAIQETYGGLVWIGTEKSGLLVYDPEANDYHRFVHTPGDNASLSNDQVKCIHQDAGGTIWIGTMSGLNRFDPNRLRFTHFDIRHGLPNDVIYGILEDAGGSLWLSTNSGLARFFPDSKTVQTYDVTDGLPGNEFNTAAYHHGTSGRMYFGGVGGLTVFRPSDIRPQEHIPPVIINELRIGNEYVEAGTQIDGRTILTKSITDTDTLKLTAEDQIIALGFAGISFTHPEAIEYRYQLEGFDPDWITTNASNRTAVYSNLPPDDYIFRVSARMKHGKWTPESRELMIVKAPPFWRTWWAYSFYIGILAIVLFYIRRYERRQDEYKHQLALQKQEREKQAEIEKAKNEFLANVSHEFRTPLTLIKGNVEDISSAMRKSHGKSMDVLQRNLERLEYLINRLLEIPKLESYSEVLDVEDLDFSAFLRRQAGDFQSLCEAAGIDLRLNIPDQNVVCRFDPEKMHIVIANLLSNAYKFTGKGGKITVTLEVKGNNETETGGLPSVFVTVQDTGVGIAPGELDRIFEKYYQVKGDEETAHKGLGIGLSLVKELVELHNGIITAESKPGIGTTMQIRLPLLHPVKPALITSPESEWTQSGEESVSERPAFPLESPVEAPILLLVEDNLDLQDYLYRHLAEDFRVHQAYNGNDGLAKAEELVPDIIVSDVMMPGKDGFSVLKSLRVNPALCHIPVILLTARSSEQDVIKGLESLADIYLVKPFKIEQLRAHLFTLLENRALVAQRYAETWYKSPDTGKVSSEDQEFMTRVRDLVRNNLDNPDFAVDDMVRSLYLSRRQVERKIKSLTNLTPSELIRSVRLQKAKEMLTTGQLTSVQEVARAVGIQDPAYFSRLFKKEFEAPPSEFIRTG